MSLTEPDATIDRVGDGNRSSQSHLSQPSTEIQPFGTMRLFPIALSHDARLESCQLINHVLADSLIVYSLYKKHHWMARGATFFQLHLLLDKHAQEQLELVDELAERVQMLGGVAIADPRHVAEVTCIGRPPNGAESAPAMLARLLGAHERIIEELRDAIARTEANGDVGSNDLLAGALRHHEMQVWFLAEHLVDVELVAAR